MILSLKKIHKVMNGGKRQMIPLAVPNLCGNERDYLNQCIDTTFISSVGEFVNRIEEMTAEKSGAEYAVATSSGTTGLHLALTGCGVKYGELVIIPAFTFIATANAVAHCSAIPWLMDISSSSWTMDADQLENELLTKAEFTDGKLIHKESGRRIAAIMPVYTLGNIPDMIKIRSIAQRYELPLIADGAAALGATYQGENIGKLADLTVFSFNGNKTVTAGGGGIIVGNDEQLMKKLKHLSTTARVTADYDHDMIGYNYRMTNIQAAVGCAQLERLDEFVQKKREIRSFYNTKFENVKQVASFPTPSDQKSACWFSGIVLKEGDLDKIKTLCEKLKEQGIEARSFWKPVHLQKPYKNTPRAQSLCVSDKTWQKILTLPCSTNITDDDLDYVQKTLKKLLAEEI